MEIMVWEDVPSGRYRTFGGKRLQEPFKVRRKDLNEPAGAVLVPAGNRLKNKTGGVIWVDNDKAHKLADALRGNLNKTIRETVEEIIGKVDPKPAAYTGGYRNLFENLCTTLSSTSK